MTEPGNETSGFHRKPGQPLRFESPFLEDSRTHLYTAATLNSIFAGVGVPPPGPIVDIGSGTGYFVDACVRVLEGNEHCVIRLDIEKQLLHGGTIAACVVASGASAPIASESVGLVLCHFVLSRVRHDVALDILAEMRRILRPGGALLVVEPCLGLATYHSKRDPSIGKLMAIARRMKAEHQYRVNGVHEDFGLELAQRVFELLDIQVIDLHVARWFTSFPDLPHVGSSDTSARRAASLQERDPIADFLNAHGSDGPPIVQAGPSFVSCGTDELELTTAGFAALQQGRIEDLLAPGDGPIDLIPVVRVLARKRTQ